MRFMKSGKACPLSIYARISEMSDFVASAASSMTRYWPQSRLLRVTNGLKRN
jgi:hypothetical protein